MSRLRIFVVDDDRDFAESLADVLELDGHQVDLAHSGEEAIDRFLEHDYDLTFMDVKLPGMSGVESFLEIRRLKSNAQVYMMTGFSVDQMLDEAVARGARGVLHKPLNVEQLLEMLANVKPEGIMIADDDPQFIDEIQAILLDAGYRVFVAHDGQQAVEQVRAGNVDVLVLDLNLPMLDALEVYLKLKDLGQCTPTIIVTSYARENPDSLGQLRGASVTGILTKPFDPEQLLAAIASLARGDSP